MNTINVTLIVVILCAFQLANVISDDEMKQYYENLHKKLCDKQLTDEQIAKVKSCYSNDEVVVRIELSEI